MQEVTLSVNSEDGQKQAASLLESHLGIESQVFIHLGTKLGHGACVLGEEGIGSEEVTAGDGSPVLDVTRGGRFGTEA
jgi:hypothetical protein